MADGVEGHEALIDMHAIDQRIGRDDVERAPGRLDYCGVVARTAHHPRSRSDVCLNPGDERALSDVRNRERLQPGPARGRRWRAETEKPRFAVWGGRMNLRKQVE